jgi:hypothetical protein
MNYSPHFKHTYIKQSMTDIVKRGALFKKAAQGVLVNANISTFCSSKSALKCLTKPVHFVSIYCRPAGQFQPSLDGLSSTCLSPYTNTVTSLHFNHRLHLPVSQHRHCFLLRWRHFAFSSCVHSATQLSAAPVFRNRCATADVPPQGFRCAANFYMKFYILT